MTSNKWQVLENAGMFNERIVDEFESYDAAIEYTRQHYTSDELLTLNVDIMKVLPDNTRTTEY